MELILETNKAQYQLQKFINNKLVISGKFYQGVILLNNTILENSENTDDSITNLNKDSKFIKQIISIKPDILLVGRKINQDIDQELLVYLYQQNIGIEIMDIQSACRTHTILANESRNFVSIFSLI